MLNLRKRPDFRIVKVENDIYNGDYYKIESKDLVGYHTYYFQVPNSPFNQEDFRFKSFDAAKEEVDLLIKGKSKYNLNESVVYKAYKKSIGDNKED